MSIYRVIIGDIYLSKESIDEIGFYSSYNKALKALKQNLKESNQKISFIPVDVDKSIGCQGEWVDLTDDYKGSFQIESIYAK